MSSSQFDLLVIGEGLAGITAAVAAASQGMSVMLAGKGPGRLVLTTASLDLEGISAADLGSFQYSPETMEEAVAFFTELSAQAGCGYEGSMEEKRLLPTVMGTFQSASLAPRSVWKGDPRTASTVVVAGIEGLSGYDADFLAERLHFHTQAMGLNTSYRSVNIKTPEEVVHHLTTVEIATRWDRDPAYRDGIVTSLQCVVNGADLLILPGVLGVKSNDADFNRLEQEIGCAICELPTVPPSVPGLRLLHHFERHLNAIGVEVCTGFSVQKLCMAGERCTGVELDVPGRPRLVQANAVVLASGRFSQLLDWQESNADCSRRTVQVNRELHPVRGDGTVIASNLFECGGVLGISEPRFGNVIAILTGHQAGLLAGKTEIRYAAQ